MLIAGRVGESLSSDGITASDRQAAELLGQSLLDDAIERVRCALSEAIKHARNLPRNLALKLAHDTDAVSCPFLEVTEVFSDSDWQQLLFTISRTARVAVARRSRMSEALAKVLSDLGDPIVAETLIENSAAPMTETVCYNLMERFTSESWVLEKLAARDDLYAEIAVKLTVMVSDAMRTKLIDTYRLPGYTESLADQAEIGAALQIVKKTPEQDLTEVAKALHGEGRLTPGLLVCALEEDHNTFLEAALSVLSGRSVEHVRSVILRAGSDAINQLLIKSSIPEDMHSTFQNGFKTIRKN